MRPGGRALPGARILREGAATTNLTSEQVHWLFGASLVIFALVMASGGLLSSDKRGGAPSPAPGLLILLLGLELLLYTEGSSLLRVSHEGHLSMAEPASPAAEHR